MEAKCVRVKRSGWKGIFLRIPLNCTECNFFHTKNEVSPQYRTTALLYRNYIRKNSCESVVYGKSKLCILVLRFTDALKP